MIIQLKIIDKEFKEYKSILCEASLLPEKVQRKQEYSLNENKSTIKKQIKIYCSLMTLNFYLILLFLNYSFLNVHSENA